MPKQPKTNPQKKPSTTPPTGSRRDELAAQTARDTRDRRIRRRVGLILAATATAVLVFTGIWLATTGPASPAATTATSGPTASGKDTWTIGVGQVDAPVRVESTRTSCAPTANGSSRPTAPA